MSAPGNELRPAVKIVDVEAWIDNNRLAYWCQRCLTWHSNGFDPSEAAPILRCAPQCQRQSADQIRLVIQGIADADMLRRFARDDPPPGIEHPGRRLDAETVKALFLTQVRWIARLIRRKVPAERVADAVQYGEALILEWDRLSDGGQIRVRRSELMARVRSTWRDCRRVREAVATALAKPVSAEFDHVHGTVTSRQIRDLVDSWTIGMTKTIQRPAYCNYEKWADAFALVGIDIESWVALSRPSGTRVEAPRFWSLYSGTAAYLWEASR